MFKSILFVAAVLLTVCCGCSDQPRIVLDHSTAKPSCNLRVEFITGPPLEDGFDKSAVPNKAILHYADRSVLIEYPGSEWSGHFLALVRYEVAKASDGYTILDAEVDGLIQPGLRILLGVKNAIQDICPGIPVHEIRFPDNLERPFQLSDL